LCTACKLITDAKSYASIVLRSQYLLDMPQSIMATITALFAHTDGSEGEVEVIY